MSGLPKVLEAVDGRPQETEHPLWVDVREVVRRWGLSGNELEVEWLPLAAGVLLGVVRRPGSDRCLLGLEVGRRSVQPLQTAPFLALPLLAAGEDYTVRSWLGMLAPTGTVTQVTALRGPDLEVAVRVAARDLAGFHGGAQERADAFPGPAHGDFVVGNLTAVGRPDRLVVGGWRSPSAGSHRSGAAAIPPESPDLPPQLQDLRSFVRSLLALGRPTADMERGQVAKLVAAVLDLYAAELALPHSSVREALQAAADPELTEFLHLPGRPRSALDARGEALTYEWPRYGEPEQLAVAEAVGSGDLSWPTGSTRVLEEALSDCLGVRYVVAHANGTSAMFSAMVAAGVGSGDEVICPSYTWWASVSPALWCGARVVFCEVGDDLAIDVDDMSSRLSSRTRAVVVPHLWGALAAVERVRSICGPDVVVIEDASHAFGTHCDGVLAGTAGDLGVMSLQAQKPLPAGEGGLLLTSDRGLFERGLMTGHYERLLTVGDEDVRDLAATGLGLKFRMSPLHASLALAQLERVPHILARQDALVQAVTRELAHLPGTGIIGGEAGVCHGGRAGLRLLLDERLARDRDEVLNDLSRAGIDATRDYLRPLHLAPLFTRMPRPVPGSAVRVGAGALPRTEALCERLVALPLPTAGSIGAARTVGQTVASVIEGWLDGSRQSKAGG